MALDGKEPVGSMGTDIPLAVLSDQPQHLSQLFQTIICTGYQSTDRSYPGKNGDVAWQLLWVTMEIY